MVQPLSLPVRPNRELVAVGEGAGEGERREGLCLSEMLKAERARYGASSVLPPPPPTESRCFFINNIPGISIYRTSTFPHHSHLQPGSFSCVLAAGRQGAAFPLRAKVLIKKPDWSPPTPESGFF